ncbi:MAG: hypothetical protein JJE03_05275 [Peptostreptococcaceae bacterium]|nr:hypothetical protein [Peptostreptococcaceae bacterium]
MKKEDVLKKYRQENEDEGQTHINTQADLYGFYGISFLALLLMVYQAIKELPFGDVPALLFTFLSIGAFFRYKAAQEKPFLWMSMFTGLMCLGFLVWYVIQTW